MGEGAKQSKRWQRLQTLFEEALGRRPEDRASFLEEACGEDAELLAQVEALLSHDEHCAPGFLEGYEPPDDVAGLSAIGGGDRQIGSVIGNYTIKAVIASGGMGTVYEAVQEQPRREVALKVMRAGIASKSGLRRFEYESQILAKLRHPNIAQVYEAGTHRDREATVPFFAMEYIPSARPITEYSRENGLSTRDRLQLFSQVCEAVHHGHQKGIIHRDLKPANILVDEAGHVKIIDFGVARATDSDIAITTLQTDVGQLIGTLQYMSPEQCAADPQDLDIRSDVYSLGVVLYELLCGQVPYDVKGTTIMGAARVICERQPARPSTINRRLRGDVELIVLKSLEKNRDNRFQSAADLVGDIRRFLDGEPIDAKPPTTWTLLIRWVRKHPKRSTTAACLTIAAFILGPPLSVWWYNFSPYKIEPADEKRVARLLSRGDGILHEWTTEAPGGIAFADLVDRSADLGGGTLAVLGFSPSKLNPYPGALCAFDVSSDRENPVWERRLDDIDLPADLVAAGHSADQFGVQVCAIQDVFPDEQHPGPEVVVTYSIRFSQRAIRIYDLAGDLLFQVWQNGGISDLYWMAGPQLLVLCGLDEDVKEGARGNDKLDDAVGPILFAMRPAVGFIRNEYLNKERGKTPLNAVWYRFLSPLSTRELDYVISLAPPDRSYHSERYVAVDIQILGRETLPGLGWIIDEFGQEVSKTRFINDAYTRDQDSVNPELPKPGEFHLSDKAPPFE